MSNADEPRVIKWNGLSWQERDELVHVEIMGKQIERCEQYLWTTGSVSGQFSCRGCMQEGTQEQLGPPHNKPVPHYTSDLNAAWQVLMRAYEQAMAQVVVLYDGTNDGTTALEILSEALLDGTWADIYPRWEVFELMKDWTPEILCIAALRAVHPEWTVMV